MSNIVINVASQFDNAGFKKAESATGALEKQAKKLGKTLLAAFSAQKILQYSKASINAYAQDQKAAALLSNQLKNLGLSYASVDVEKFIANLEQQTGILDDELRPAFSKLVRVTGSVAESQNLMQVAFDTSRGAGIDYMTAVDALSKAYVGNLKGLKKLNLGLTDAELKTMSFGDIVKKLNKQFSGAGAASVDTYAGKMDKLNVATANAQEIIGKGFVDAFTMLSEDKNFTDVTTTITNMAQAISDSIVGVGIMLNKLNASMPQWLKDLISMGYNKAGMGVAGMLGKQKRQQDLIGLGGSYYTYRAQQILAAEAEKKARDKALAAERARLALLRKQTNEKKAQAAIDKANATLGKAQDIFDIEKISVAAAMANTTLTENERKRLEVKQAIFALEDAIASKDTARIDAATKTLNGLTGQLMALQAQDSLLGKVKTAYDALGMNKDLINLENLKAALDMLQKMNLLMNGTKTPTASNSLISATGGSTYIPAPYAKPFTEIAGNAQADLSSTLAAAAWDLHEKTISKTMNPNYSTPVIIKVEGKANDLVNFIYDTVTDQSASGNPPIVTRIGQNLAW